MVTRLSAAPAAAAFVLLGIAIGAGGGASANPGAGASANQPVAGDIDSVTIRGLTAEPSLDFGCPLPGGPTGQPCTLPPSGRAPGHLPLAPRGLLVIRTPRPPDPRGPRPQVSSITVVLGFAPRRATGSLKRIVVQGRARPNSEHTRWTFRLPRHIAGNELDLVLDDTAVEAFGVTTDPSCA